MTEPAPKSYKCKICGEEYPRPIDVAHCASRHKTAEDARMQRDIEHVIEPTPKGIFGIIPISHCPEEVKYLSHGHYIELTVRGKLTKDGLEYRREEVALRR